MRRLLESPLAGCLLPPAMPGGGTGRRTTPRLPGGRRFHPPASSGICSIRMAPMTTLPPLPESPLADAGGGVKRDQMLVIIGAPDLEAAGPGGDYYTAPARAKCGGHNCRGGVQ